MGRLGLRIAGMQSKYPCNSLGHVFETVQEAIDDLESDGEGGWVYVPPGTWTEALTIQDADICLFGAGWSSIINGATSGHAIALNASADRCVIRDLTVRTTPGGGNAYNGIDVASNCDHIIIYNVRFNGSDQYNLYVDGDNCKILYCFLYDSDSAAFALHGARTKVLGNYIQQAGQSGIDVWSQGDDSVFRGNIIHTTGADGIAIHANAENCVIDGNRITAFTILAIDDASGTSTVGDNDET